MTDLIKTRAGLKSAREAHRALMAGLGALRCALEDDEARQLATGLPGRWRRPFETRSGIVHDVEALYAEAERRERAGRGFAREHLQVVLEALAEELDAERVALLRKHLPPDISALLVCRTPPPDVPPQAHEQPPVPPPPRQTLSEARPGAAEPIAEAGHPLAHAASVARSAAPHADRMVETARSTRPGREDDTLANSREIPTRR